MQVKPNTPFGVRLTNVDLRNPAHLNQIPHLVDQHGLLIFPQDAPAPGAPPLHDHDGLVALSSTLGPLQTGFKLNRYLRDGSPVEVLETSGNSGLKPYADRMHSDASWRDVPDLASVLCCKLKPASGGGNTSFFNVSALTQPHQQAEGKGANFISTTTSPADENTESANKQPNGMKKSKGRMLLTQETWDFLKHTSFDHSYVFSIRSLGPDSVQLRTNPHIVTAHPGLVAHPRTARPVVYANDGNTWKVSGRSAEESLPLLDRLYAEMYRAELVYEHNWSEGDVLVWDNIALQHSAKADYASRRVMHRVRVRDEGLRLQAFREEGAVAE